MNRSTIVRGYLLVQLAAALLLGLAAPRAVRAAGGQTGTVDSTIGLNLRAGPGLNYRILLVLKDNEALELLGRSQDSQWLEVRLPASGLGGWVFATFVDTEAKIADLPVSEAAGGPTGLPPAAQNYSLYVTILDNQATVYLQRYPANAEITLRLGPAGSAANLVVASGRTDAEGKAQISFAMPAKWGNGQAVVERNQVLVASTADGKFSRSANIVYIK